MGHTIIFVYLTVIFLKEQRTGKLYFHIIKIKKIYEKGKGIQKYKALKFKYIYSL